MKKYLLILLLLISSRFVYSQEFYDLIVKSNGDSIVCHIDSITKTQIYFNTLLNLDLMYLAISLNGNSGEELPLLK